METRTYRRREDVALVMPICRLSFDEEKNIGGGYMLLPEKNNEIEKFAQTLFDEADIVLYLAKSKGKDRYEVIDKKENEGE